MRREFKFWDEEREMLDVPMISPHEIPANASQRWNYKEERWEILIRGGYNTIIYFES